MQMLLLLLDFSFSSFVFKNEFLHITFSGPHSVQFSVLTFVKTEMIISTDFTFPKKTGALGRACLAKCNRSSQSSAVKLSYNSRNN